LGTGKAPDQNGRQNKGPGQFHKTRMPEAHAGTRFSVTVLR
jgi:hypothetical protein